METPLLLNQYYLKINEKAKYLFIVLITMLVFLNATSQVTANFTTTTSTNGCGSLLVEFKDLSIGNPTSWLWDFGNGNTSTLQNPVAVYNMPGIYDVVLTVSDGFLTDVKHLPHYIKIHEEPVAALELNSASNGCMPLNTSFEDASIQLHQ